MPAVGRLRYLEAGPHRSPSPEFQRTRGVLVLIHAYPLNARMWEPQLALAERGWRVIAPHLRGFADGAADPSASSLDDYAGDVIDLLDALHITDAVIVGLSMGGYIALTMFRHAARYFHGLVLADTRSQADTPEAVAGRQRMLQLLADHGAEGVADEMIPKLLGETTRRTRPDIAAEVRTMILENSAAAIAGATRALMTRLDTSDVLRSIHCPTLILVGDEDIVTPEPLSEQLHRGIAGSELEVVRGAGHLANLERPDEFNRALARFLDHRV